jgi:hypothetical protein
MFLKYDPYRVWCSIFYSKLVNCILFKIIVKGRGTCNSGERNVKILIDFRKSPRISLTSPLHFVKSTEWEVAPFLLHVCVVSPDIRLTTYYHIFVKQLMTDFCLFQSHLLSQNGNNTVLLMLFVIMTGFSPDNIIYLSGLI